MNYSQGSESIFHSSLYVPLVILLPCWISSSSLTIKSSVTSAYHYIQLHMYPWAERALQGPSCSMNMWKAKAMRIYLLQKSNLKGVSICLLQRSISILCLHLINSASGHCGNLSELTVQPEKTELNSPGAKTKASWTSDGRSDGSIFASAASQNWKSQESRLE